MFSTGFGHSAQMYTKQHTKSPNNTALSHHDNVLFVNIAVESSASSTKPSSQWTDFQVNNNLITFVTTKQVL